ncbi:MAG: hypothetical protein ACI9T8_000645 [Candidatus Saccharimonadales bacterium]|jgi:hypothetical protein
MSLARPKSVIVRSLLGISTHESEPTPFGSELLPRSHRSSSRRALARSYEGALGTVSQLFPEESVVALPPILVVCDGERSMDVVSILVDPGTMCGTSIRNTRNGESLPTDFTSMTVDSTTVRDICARVQAMKG